LKLLLTYLLFAISFHFLAMSPEKEFTPVARFSFNERSDYDEINNRKIKLVGTLFAHDRFGNPDHAIFVSGDLFSYVNLGNYPELKQRSGTISLWINILHRIYSGKGLNYNPIILTRARKEHDFSEAYCMYYDVESGKSLASCARDSIRQIGITGIMPMSRNAWHHLVVSYDDDSMAFYIDGVLQRKAKKGYETKFLETDSVLVGSTGSVKNVRFLDAEVDDIEFYNRVLSTGEIQELFNAPNPNEFRLLLNKILVGLSVPVAILLLYFFIRYRLSQTMKKERQRLELANQVLETELRINRALMNPHFMFNSLNTLHSYIVNNNTEKASDYLLKFSKLVRKVLDSNMSDTISLDMEIELIERYLEIESMRFQETIRHSIKIDPDVVPSSIVIPIMMLQPFIENSVWHGLRDKPGEKVINIHFSLYETKYIQCIIDDNGTGRKKRPLGEQAKKSLATGFVEQRLLLLNRIHGLKSSLSIVDKPDFQGTVVRIILPILNR